MRKTIATAISVFLLVGNTMSCEGYIPKEFWTDEAAAKEALTEAVPMAIEKLGPQRVRCDPYVLDESLAIKIAEVTYSYIQKYMEKLDRNTPSEKEILESIGIYRTLEWKPDYLYKRTYEFLDYVGKIVEDELY